jgi:cell wall-associated NlpC family hydrolase
MEKDGHYLCHSAEGYIGYVAADDVTRVTAAELSDSQSLPRATFTATTKAENTTLPAGAHLKLLKSAPAEVTVRVPGAGDVTIPSAAVAVTDEQAALAKVLPVIAAARQFMGTKYVWGGKSLDGIDCSGLVQTSFQTQGVRLPRDADQQGYVGQLVATRWHRADLRPGDTLYFLSRTGRIHHTAIFVGHNEFIEAASPGVKITSFDPAAPNYDEKRDKSFCFAKRILD